MAVKVIGSDVENDGDLGMKLLRALQLEARHFEHRPGLVGAFVDQSEITGTPMLPPTRVGMPAALRISPTSEVVVVLPLDPVMARVLPLRKRAASSSSPMTGRPKLRTCDQFRRIERDAGADHDQVLAAKRQQAVAAGFDIDAFIEQRGDILGERLCAADIGNRDLGAPPAQKQCRGQAGLSQPDHQYLLALEFHHRSTSGISATPLFCTASAARPTRVCYLV